MVYIDLGAVASGDVITSAWGNQVRTNFQAGAVDAMVAKGDLFVGTGADAGARVAAGPDDATLVADAAAATGLAWQIQPAARVYRNVAFDPTPTAWDTIDFTHERSDTDGMWAIGTPSRLTVPVGGDGWYTIGGNAEFDVGGVAGASNLGLRILLNGATVLRQDFSYETDSGIAVTRGVETSYPLAAGNFVELQVYTSLDVNVLASGNYSPEFWAIWQRRV